jgi:hypothetical protein
MTRGDASTAVKLAGAETAAKAPIKKARVFMICQLQTLRLTSHLPVQAHFKSRAKECAKERQLRLTQLAVQRHSEVELFSFRRIAAEWHGAEMADRKALDTATRIAAGDDGTNTTMSPSLSTGQPPSWWLSSSC